MGKGIDPAREFALEHAAVMDDFKDQLLLVFLRRLGGKISIPVSKCEDTGSLLLAFSLNDGVFDFELLKKS